MGNSIDETWQSSTVSLVQMYKQVLKMFLRKSARGPDTKKKTEKSAGRNGKILKEEN